MRKEIKENVKGFKNRIAELYVLLDKCNTDKNADHQMMKVRGEMEEWLKSIAKISSEMSQEDQHALWSKLYSAMTAITHAGRTEADLRNLEIKYAKNYKGRKFSKQVQLLDMERMSEFAEMYACEKVRQIEKLNKKINRKDFLNVAACRFKKSKVQSKEREKGSEEQAKI